MNKNIWRISAVYITTVIGAGFASGQEILQFFVRYGNKSSIAIVFVALGFAFVASSVLNRARISNIDDFKLYLDKIMGKGMAKVVDVVITIFMIGVFSVMSAGTGTVLAQVMGISRMVGAGLMCVLCFICFLFDSKGIMTINGFLAPIIIIGLVFICFYILFFREVQVFSSNISKITNNWILSGTSYVSYNILTASVVLVGLRKYIHSNRESTVVGLISGGFLGSILCLIWVVIKIYYGKIDLGELPMLTLVIRQGKTIGMIYTGILAIAMTTSALSSGYGIMVRMSCSINISKTVMAFFICSIGFAGAGIGFSGLIEKVYRFCGYAGSILLIAILIDGIRMKIGNCKNKVKICNMIR